MADVKARAFYKAVTVDAGAVLEQLLDLLEQLGVTYCVVGGQAVNAYVDPLVSLDLDLVVAAADLERVLAAMPPGTEVQRFPHSVDLSLWSASDPALRASKRQKDLADIARLIERFPELHERVPTAVLEKLI